MEIYLSPSSQSTDQAAMPGTGVDWCKYFEDRQHVSEQPLKKARLEGAETLEQTADGGSSASTDRLDTVSYKNLTLPTILRV